MRGWELCRRWRGLCLRRLSFDRYCCYCYGSCHWDGHFCAYRMGGSVWGISFSVWFPDELSSCITTGVGINALVWSRYVPYTVESNMHDSEKKLKHHSLRAPSHRDTNRAPRPKRASSKALPYRSWTVDSKTITHHRPHHPRRSRRFEAIPRISRPTCGLSCWWRDRRISCWPWIPSS